MGADDHPRDEAGRVFFHGADHGDAAQVFGRILVLAATEVRGGPEEHVEQPNLLCGHRAGDSETSYFSIRRRKKG